MSSSPGSSACINRHAQQRGRALCIVGWSRVRKYVEKRGGRLNRARMELAAGQSRVAPNPTGLPYAMQGSSAWAGRALECTYMGAVQVVLNCCLCQN